MDANAPGRGESPRPRVSGLAVVGAVVVLVAIVAIASSGSAPSGGIAERRPSESLLDTFVSLFLLMMVLGTALVAVMLSFFGRQSLGGVERKRRGPVQSLITFAVGMGLVAILVHVLAKSEGDRAVILRPGPGDGTDGGGGRANRGYEPEFAVWPVIGVSAFLLLAGAAWWLSARGRRRAIGERAELTPREALADVLASTLDDLRAEADPRRAVIGAYARMERSLASVGLPRTSAEAPDEYLERVLAAVDVSARAAGRLTALFTWARFSVHDVRPGMKDEAIETLEQIQQELAAAESERAARLAGAIA